MGDRPAFDWDALEHHEDMPYKVWSRSDLDRIVRADNHGHNSLKYAEAQRRLKARRIADARRS